jgi:3-methyladenine DNA glycosylase AlkD
MTASQVLAALRKLGKPGTAAIYRRHGAGENVLGVLTSEIEKLRKKIGVDPALARELWKSGIGEARILALQVADPARLTRKEAESFIRDEPGGFVGCYLSALVARSPIAEAAMRAWMKSPREPLREAGYGVASARLKEDPASIPDAEAARILGTIEREIHGSPNRARHAMNGALIAIGVWKPALRARAIAAAGRIGKVEVDHGETACTTPDAASYIRKAAARPGRA